MYMLQASYVDISVKRITVLKMKDDKIIKGKVLRKQYSELHDYLKDCTKTATNLRLWDFTQIHRSD